MPQRQHLRALLALPAVMVICSCFKGKTIQVVRDGNERVEVISRLMPGLSGSAEVALIHFKGDGSTQAIRLHGFDTEARHEVVSCTFNRDAQTSTVTTTKGTVWEIDLKLGKAILRRNKKTP